MLDHGVAKAQQKGYIMTNNTISENDKKIICETAKEILKKSKEGWLWPHVFRKQVIDACKEQLSEPPKQSNAYVTECNKILRELPEMFPAEIHVQDVPKKDGTLYYRFLWVGPLPRTAWKETKFYAPFAKWLEIQKECTKAVSTGDKVRGKKWSNPDVVGVKKTPGLGGAMNYELISAEIKISISTGEIISGFGQACAYKLFSHKTYLVVPSDSNEDDLQRIKELCEQYDIGLIVFDNKNPANPDFEIRCSAKSRGKPNPSYINNSIKAILKEEGYDIFVGNDEDSTKELRKKWIEGFVDKGWEYNVSRTKSKIFRIEVAGIPFTKENIDQLKGAVAKVPHKNRRAVLNALLETLEK